MISAINNEGKVRFMIYKDSMISSRLIDFMNRLIKDTGRKVYLILDKPEGCTTVKMFAKWLEKKKDKITVFYLPS